MYKTFLEGTVASDIAQSTSKTPMRKKRMDNDEECQKELEIKESPVGAPGRTGYKDAEAHLTPELRAEFKKIVKKLGGKTVARKLLQEMNDGML